MYVYVEVLTYRCAQKAAHALRKEWCNTYVGEGEGVVGVCVWVCVMWVYIEYIH